MPLHQNSLLTKADGISQVLRAKAGDLLQTIRENPLQTAGLVTAPVLGGLAVRQVFKRRKKRKTSRKRKTIKRKRSRRSNGRKRKTKRRRYKYARTAGKRKDTSTRRIRQTKNGQPYIILASGKAKFISRRSARLSRKRKGGRY